MALFVLASKDGWVEIMYNAIDARGKDQQVFHLYNYTNLLIVVCQIKTIIILI